jgi:NAD-dependent deacetylase
MNAFPPEFCSFLRRAERVVVLTGAGVSAESGIPTFRDAQTGLWARYRPEDLATPEAFARNPKLVWDWYAMRRQMVLQAQPNPGHLALVEMEKHVPDFTLITQNVDGLHQAAGSRNVVPLHGDIRRVRCSECGFHPDAWDENAAEVPRCPACGGLLRPDVVWFGENLPPGALGRAMQASEKAQAFLVVGTSAVVQPAASLWQLCARRGGVVAEINLEPTAISEWMDYGFYGKAGEVLPALVQAVWGAA